jgi:NAD(P)-dependent dehydrogenase (short-subunit alcohol dehydrogenase family)
VVAADVDEAGGAATAAQIAAAGGDGAFVRADVSLAGDVEALVAAAVARYGRLDCAHNNAGIAAGGGPTAELPLDVWERVLRVNLTGVFLCLRAELGQMLRQGGGAIVNTASVAGLVGGAGIAAYVASKHGVVGLTKATALEYAAQGIRINAVCPGLVRTPMTAGLLADPERAAGALAREPIGRVGTPEEIAAAVVWLCSDAAAFVTGLAMAVDGGYVAQ